MGIILSTGDLPPKERGAFWRHVMSDTFAPVTIHEMAEGDVAGSIRSHWAGRLLVAGVQSTAQEHRRTPRLIREADNAYFQVAIVAGGTGRIAQDGRQAVLGPGDGVLYENTRPFQWQFDDDWNVWVFSLPSESVRLSGTEQRLLSARRLDGTTGLTGVVSRFLLDLARHGEDLPAGQSERVLAHASDLVVTLLSDRLDDGTRVRGAVQRSLMLRIKDYIGQRFRDPALGPAEIAAAVSISTRYLHKLFEADRQTVSLYIKGLRLDRARQDLLDPRQAGRSISAIAYSCGFGDLSGFNRAFKQAYAVSPKELRNASASTADRPLPLLTVDEDRCGTLGDGERRGVRIGGNDRGHDGGVGDAERRDAADPAAAGPSRRVRLGPEYRRAAAAARGGQAVRNARRAADRDTYLKPVRGDER